MEPQDIVNRFSHNTVSYRDVTVMSELRSRTLELAEFINQEFPDGREKSTSITKLEEAVFWANAGKSRNSSERV